jgi:hypothetical protein
MSNLKEIEIYSPSLDRTQKLTEEHAAKTVELSKKGKGDWIYKADKDANSTSGSKGASKGSKE